jgi:putative aldouronate transport system substrate-binding protein
MKRKTYLKIITLMLIGMMLFATACSNSAKTNEPQQGSSPGAGDTTSGNSSSTGEEPATEVDTSPLGKYETPVQINVGKWVGPSDKYPEGESDQDNFWTRAYRDELGINANIVWTALMGEHYDQKTKLAIASDDLPDLMTVNAQQLAQLVENDMIADLTDAVEQYASDLTKHLLYADGGMAMKSVTFNDRIMAIPVTGSMVDSSNVLWIRQDWLDKLGLEPPKTTEDLKKIAEAFTTRDPDGNGKKDTYGLAVSRELWSSTGTPGLEGFFNSYHAYPTIWLEDESGQLVYGAVQPAIKKGLADLQEMYKKGWIDPEFGVKDASRVSEDLNASKLGMLFGKMSTPFYFLASIMADPSIEWRSYPIPSVDGTPSKTQQDFPVTSYFVVRKGYEHPEAVVKMLNLREEVLRGSGDVHERLNQAHAEWVKTTEGFAYQALVYGDLPTKNIDAYANVNKAIASGDESVLTTDEEKNVYLGILDYMDTKNPAQLPYWMVFGPEGSQSVLYEYYTANRYIASGFYGAATPAMTSKQSTLDKLILQEFTKMIVGNSSIDDFEKFVSDWNNVGGAEVTREVNEWRASR